MAENRRKAGVLMHITSLPGKFGIGDFGPKAYEFADRLAAAGFRLWQMLPLGPTGFGNSPYSALSAFAGNELLVSPELLEKEGWLESAELKEAAKKLEGYDPAHVFYNRVRAVKMPLLERAAERALKDDSFRTGFEAFCKQSAYWLEDYALYMLLYEKYGDARWYSVWDTKEGFRDPETLEKLKKDNAEKLEVIKAVQFFFNDQCKRLQAYLHSLGILSIGDIPIFVGMDSTDTWADMKLFKTDGEGHFTDISGVPPDMFCPDGQLWGTPVYDWAYHGRTKYAWWIKRIRRCLELNDIIRIDHFRGFDAYYDIPAGSKTARHGVWTKVPGEKLFRTLRQEMGKLPIIAEDLGNITPDVLKLRDENGFPGMKISQFGFDLKKNGELRLGHGFLARNYGTRCVAYTGTHDNDTTRSWFDSLGVKLADKILEYLKTDRNGVVFALVGDIMRSKADTVVVPMQDLLELPGFARMNYPSSCNDTNWSWRMEEGAFSDEIVRRYKELIAGSGRAAE